MALHLFSQQWEVTGGATADGQREILAAYGITEATMGCPIRATMDVVELESGGSGITALHGQICL